MLRELAFLMTRRKMPTGAAMGPKRDEPWFSPGAGFALALVEERPDSGRALGGR